MRRNDKFLPIWLTACLLGLTLLFLIDLSKWAGMYFALIFLSKLMIGLGSINYFTRISGANFEVLEKFGQGLPGPLRLVYGFENEIPNFPLHSFKDRAACILGILVAIPFLGGAVYEVFQKPNVNEHIAAALFVVIESMTLLYFLNLGRRIVYLENLYWQQIEVQEKVKHQAAEEFQNH